MTLLAEVGVKRNSSWSIVDGSPGPRRKPGAGKPQLTEKKRAAEGNRKIVYETWYSNNTRFIRLLSPLRGQSEKHSKAVRLVAERDAVNSRGQRSRKTGKLPDPERIVPREPEIDLGDVVR
ncbi:hypothetical protein BH18ACI4_BH18ACI4_15380 [soil metagenome]